MVSTNKQPIRQKIILFAQNDNLKNWTQNNNLSRKSIDMMKKSMINFFKIEQFLDNSKQIFLYCS